MLAALQLQAITTFGKLDVLSPSIEAVGDSIKEYRLHVFDKTTRLKFLIDSGSVVSVLPRAIIKQKLQLSDIKLYAANNTCISTYGHRPLTINLGLRRAFTWPFIVADVQSAIIGADFIVHYGLLIDLQQQRLIDSLTSLTTTEQLAQVNEHGFFHTRPALNCQHPI